MRESAGTRRLAAHVRCLAPTVASLALVGLAVSAAAQTVPQCREANDQALAALRSTLPDMSEQDRATAETLINELEHLVAERRAAGADECAIWQEITRRVWRS
jgi:hypothetical protein